MTSTQFSTVKTIADIENPIFDGRVKSGIRSLKIIPAGTVLKLDKGNPAEYQGPELKYQDSPWVGIKYEFLKELIECSEEFVAESYSELLYQEGYSATIKGQELGSILSISEKLMQKLVEEGVVNLLQVKEMIREIEDGSDKIYQIDGE